MLKYVVIVPAAIFFFAFSSVLAQISPLTDFDYPRELPIYPGTEFYLTGTPFTHSTGGTQAAIDFQIVNESGFVDKGAELFAPMEGDAIFAESGNGSALIEITQNDKKWRVQIAHIVSDTKLAKALIETYPKHVKKAELIAYQGDSGANGGYRMPIHVHYEFFTLEDIQDNKYIYTNDNLKIDVCEKLGFKEHCRIIDESNDVLLIHDL